MTTRNVVLTDDQDDFVKALIASGRYQNASEALRAGLRLLEQEESQTLALRDRLKAALAQAEAGDRAPGSGAEAVQSAFAEARQRWQSQ
ncbi:MAG: type II toxin-antitoxin system ParD family antitoxin [Maritimibacter sp.]